MFHVDIPGAGGLWDDAFEEAMYRWNDATNFKFRIVRDSYGDPCRDPNVSGAMNGVAFSDSICGVAWSDQTIAISITWIINNTNEIVQTGVVFNGDEDWDIYSGPWWRDPYFEINDFRRVAVHELGHGLGLESHEPPYIRDGNPRLLEPGMTFTIEPGIYIPGRGGVRIEDDVVMTKKGLHSFSDLPREVQLLDI